MGFKNRVSSQVSSAASQFTKAVKAPFSNRFVQGALSRARSELAQVGRALGGLKIPVGIEKQVVSTGFNNITTYGHKTKTINDQFSQFAKVGDRVEGGGKGKTEKGKLHLKNIDQFIAGNKKFDEVIDDYARHYVEVIEIKNWSWANNIQGGNKLTSNKRKMIKLRAEELGLIPKVLSN
ncbi:hypothetical protein [Bacillus massilinigeriensis]|uniref:hypothetical protein n=1 Tax=Bacillus mediterraneensis TaxID=1805474 RepID=UPI001F321A32|nr:hypothetical protein [Bacillus mediterraneensis]